MTDLYSAYERINSVSPRTLLKIVLYSYMNGDYSSRSMELNCKRDINFMFLLEGTPVAECEQLYDLKIVYGNTVKMKYLRRTEQLFQDRPRCRFTNFHSLKRQTQSWLIPLH